MSQPVESNVIWLTQEAHDRLQEELDHLRGPARAELAARIGEARDEGDLRENGGYHAAKEEQGKAEARIRQLEDMLRRAEVGDLPSQGDPVGPGMVVTIRFAGDDETEEFLLGSRELLALDDSVEMDVYSPQSPLGSAVRGLGVGESASYEAPNGNTVAVEVVGAKPFRS
ncbi:MAG: transcription elongation factor GreA [Nocardioidaceae bacterium]|nr:transcription elongation factor GreA [Nocardioidaceae bacterium]